jgi:hypothetical protein
MQISSSTHGFRIATQLKTALGDAPYSADDGKKSSSASASVNVDTALISGSAQSALQLTLAANAVNGGGDASSSPGHVTNILNSLTPSDIKLITDATGSTYTNGELIGGIDSSNLQVALYAMRTTGTGEGNSVEPVTGDITAAELRAFIQRGISGMGNSEAINHALDILDSRSDT